jgi:deazaflavin-dependent oxidoreductase (nitroreductase family)
MVDFDLHTVIDLTTVGRVTGRPHTIEIWFTLRASTVYMLSGGGDRSDWIRNLIHTPEVRVRVGGHEYPGLGRIVTEPDEERLARDAVYHKYVVRYRGDLTDWREKALPVAVDLNGVT